MQHPKIDKQHITEAEIQAQLYSTLWENKIPAYLERSFKLHGQTTRRTGKTREIRTDIALTYGDTVYAVIEVKNNYKTPISDKSKGNLGTQVDKYRKLGLPFIYCCSETQIDATVQWAKEQLKIYLSQS